MTDSPAALCYACDQPESTQEHAPPRSFFPEGHRNNLITVPACPQHNKDNSKDVEYTRNVITTKLGVNELGEQLFAGKVSRSLDRSPGLKISTFKTMQPAVIGELQTGSYQLDVNRVMDVMVACVRALHFKETGEKKADWGIILPDLIFTEEVPDNVRESWQKLAVALGQLPYVSRTTGNPEIFEYGVATSAGKPVYSLRFYKGFSVFALSTGLQRCQLENDEHPADYTDSVISGQN